MIKTWNEDKPGWYLSSAKLSTGIIPAELVSEKAEEIICWLYKELDACEKHCRWRIEVQENDIFLRVKFRHEKDCVWFKLRWG